MLHVEILRKNEEKLLWRPYFPPETAPSSGKLHFCAFRVTRPSGTPGGLQGGVEGGGLPAPETTGPTKNRLYLGLDGPNRNSEGTFP